MSDVRRNAIARGREWVARATETLTVRDPYCGAGRLARRGLGLPFEIDDLIEYWLTQVDGTSGELRRYPWLLSYRRWINPPPYAGAAESWTSWRAAERQLNRASELSYWFATSIAVSHNGEILELAAASGNADARAMLDAFSPVMRRDFALYIAGEHPWTDTFSLWNLTRTGLLFNRLQPLAIALAMTFAASAREKGGVVHGVGYPYHEVPLASASAHLASALLSIGIETSLLASLLGFLTSKRGPSGAWSDGTDPEELLTTLVTAELLSSIDPGFDPAPAEAFVLKQQEADGAWRVMGPELPWLTAEATRWLETLALPFPRRFRWPRLAESTTDSKTRLPGFGYFRAYAELCAGLPGLAASPTELAFLDLAGFKTFNDRFGQDAGDEVILVLAKALDGIPETRAVRDGGDEFLILGAPTDEHLEDRIRPFLERWPGIFRASFGDDSPVVAPRVCVGAGRGDGLRNLRETLGRSITQLKREAPKPEPTGALKRI